MGYHLIDLLVWYFGLPDKVFAQMNYNSREDQVYNVEDTAKITFDYFAKKISGSLFISRVYTEKKESLTVIGTKGLIKLEKGSLTRFDTNGTQMEKLTREGSWLSAGVEQIDYFCDVLNSDKNPYLSHFEHIAFLEACYKSQESGTFEEPKKFLFS